MKKIILAVMLMASAILLAQKPVFSTAKMKSATVYFNAAELTQSATVNLPAGTSEIVIKNVANALNESTVRIGAPKSLTVLSVQFTNNYISEFEPDENSPVLRKVRDSITLVQKEITKVQTEKNSNAKTIELLDRNQLVSGANTGLSVAELTKMVEYYRVKRNELGNTLNSLQEKENKLNELVRNLNNKLEINTDIEEKNSTGKLILQVMNEVAGNVPLDISYLTQTASWSPFYDLRADNISTPINMVYKAQVRQSSGVDWKKVKLSLSSGYPNQNNQAPELNPWFLNYYHPNYKYSAVYDKKEDDAMAKVRIQGYSSNSEVQQNSVGANQIVTQLAVSFDIEQPYDILSNGKLHSVALKEIKLPATYTFYAAPRVEKEAFLLAQIDDYSEYHLLPGEANIIFEGMHVGKTMINPNETSDTLRLSMGRDKKISIKREKVADKSGTKFLSSNKEQTFTYDITVRNNKDETIALLLKDQYPLTTDTEVTVELLQSDHAKVDKELGMLTWDLKLSPNETKKIRISYKIRYPKDKPLANL